MMSPPITTSVNVGERIGCGIVIDPDIPTNDRPNRKYRYAKLMCDCGNVYLKQVSQLKAHKSTKSCGYTCELRKTIAIGQQIGYGIVISNNVRIKSDNNRRGARLLCQCGNIYETSIHNLTPNHSGHTIAKSCGCYHREKVTRHGLSQTYLYTTWLGMMHRCYNPKTIEYKNYGGRGIQVCDEWHTVTVFIDNIQRLLGERPEAYSLDRINNDGNYCPGNVRWASAETQANNRRNSKRSSKS